MIIHLLIASNPFFEAYYQSDLLGKSIFLGLIALSIISWGIIIHKLRKTLKARKNSLNFQKNFQQQRGTPLAINIENFKEASPFQAIYLSLKKHTLDLLNKNRHFKNSKEQDSFLSSQDISYVESNLMTQISSQVKGFEKHLFILATIVSLGPFLGLSGTVWGILITFSQLQTFSSGNTQVILGGLSLALATTVLGLVDAIPALIGYNYLKNDIKEFQIEMENFAQEALSSIEMQYRKVD